MNTPKIVWDALEVGAYALFVLTAFAFIAAVRAVAA